MENDNKYQILIDGHVYMDDIDLVNTHLENGLRLSGKYFGSNSRFSDIDLKIPSNIHLQVNFNKTCLVQKTIPINKPQQDGIRLFVYKSNEMTIFVRELYRFGEESYEISSVEIYD